jgi:hypothetical protein
LDRSIRIKIDILNETYNVYEYDDDKYDDYDDDYDDNGEYGKERV